VVNTGAISVTIILCSKNSLSRDHISKELMRFIIFTKIVLVGVPSVEITCDEDYCGLLEGGNSSKFLGMSMEISMH